MDVLKCNVCQVLFENLQLFYKHLRLNHPKDVILLCPRCEGPFDSYRSIQRHIERTCLIKLVPGEYFNAVNNNEVQEEGEVTNEEEIEEAMDNGLDPDEFVKIISLKISKLQNQCSIPRETVTGFFMDFIETFQTIYERMGEKTEDVLDGIKQVIGSQHKRIKFMADEIQLLIPKKVSYDKIIHGHYILPSDAIERIIKNNVWRKRLIESFKGKEFVIFPAWNDMFSSFIS